ncbi:T9SS type A sorting domain-containing protein [Hymenobacter sp. B81]|uniref:T9SS type A sorting domain-containing protein n=1 Tax=Hymenobacter sp. B81 TaxID=3344878 RepID=UPI0037DCA88F
MTSRRAFTHFLPVALCWVALWLAPVAARAQAPAWTAATIGSSVQHNGSSLVRGIAVDVAGNVFVTGHFGGQVAFGNTVLTGTGSSDIFIAKYVPSTNTWAWVVRAGGTGGDQGNAIAVSGASVYVTGVIQSNLANATNVRFDTGSGSATAAQPGASSASGEDLFVAKYTDNGNSASLNWTQVAGGTGYDVGTDIAVSGTSVYVTGNITNSATDASSLRFGGSGSTPGTQVQNGASTANSRDLVVAKYTDNGTSASVSWVEVAGGTNLDQSASIAVDGTGVFVTGSIINSQTDVSAVRFGGTAAQAGAHANNTRDLVVAKYTDGGSSATFDWSQVGGGAASDEGTGIAVSGSSVYVTGALTNTKSNANGVLFGGSGLVAGTAQQLGASTANSGADLVVAKYTDHGTSASLGWTQVGGGNQADGGLSITASGTDVYVSGNISNTSGNANQVFFGGSGTMLAAVARPSASSVYSHDALVAKYTDNGASATLDWTQVAGGSRQEYGQDIALLGGTLYVGGQINPSVTGFSFGAANAAALAGTRDVRATISTLAAADGSWQTVASPVHGGTSFTRAVATDANGNVFVTGFFTGQITFGSTVLTTDGVTEGGSTSNDIFVAKYVPSTGTWAWALSGGGTGADGANGIAVQTTDGVTSVYVTGTFFNSTADANLVRFGGTGATAGTVQVNGVNTNNNVASNDLILLKFTDLGTSATLDWNQVAGGYGNDQGYGVAVEGNSVYITGHIHNTTGNSSNVRFGSSGTTLGSFVQRGAHSSSFTNNTDVVVAKYTDNGASATFNWSQVGGGREADAGYAIAVATVDGTTNVYVTGQITSNLSDNNTVRFGGSGNTLASVQQNGASTNGVNSGTGNDLFVAKYTDNGNSASLGWTQVAGGNLSDAGYGIAADGTSVYVTGFITNTAGDLRLVRFGGSGTTPGTVQQNGASASASADLIVARYTDNGSSAGLDWTQVGGGTGADQGYGIVVDTANVYVAGYITNSSTDGNAVRFGGSGTTAGTTVQNGASTSASRDVVVAKYADAGPAATVAWTRVGGGTGGDEGYGIALHEDLLYPVGMVVPAATFGSFTFNTPTAGQTDFLGELPTTFAPLPVKLTAFEAAAEGRRAVRLTWATAQEENSAFFEVERSLDGHSFERVGRRTAAGHSNSPRRYSLLDEDLPASAAVLHYRLRQVDHDGTFSYSPVRSVLLTAPAGLALFPNPATGRTTLTGALPGSPVQVFDALGRPVLTTTTDSTGAAALALPAHLAPGVYVLRTGAMALRLVVE